MKEKYRIERICFKCDYTQSTTINKREAAFDLVNYHKIFGEQCPLCSNKKFTINSLQPNLDFELLKEWSLDSELHLMEQDEELLLADESYLDIILKTLDTINLLDHKRNVLMEALCVIVYDNTIESSSEKDETLKSRVIKELNLRKDKLKLANDWIMDYVKEVVYPLLK